jgi:hypothetical protein
MGGYELLLDLSNYSMADMSLMHRPSLRLAFLRRNMLTLRHLRQNDLGIYHEDALKHR